MLSYSLLFRFFFLCFIVRQTEQQQPPPPAADSEPPPPAPSQLEPVDVQHLNLNTGLPITCLKLHIDSNFAFPQLSAAPNILLSMRAKQDSPSI
jgi:hypothetical protein